MGSGKPPKTIGSYRLEKEISRTAVSTTFLATSASSGSRVALKVMRSGDAPGLTSEGFQLIANEAEISKTLDHPNIVRIHKAGVAGSNLFVAMTPVQGLSVEAALSKKGKFSARTAAEIALETAKALAFSHGRGIYHKNLKSTNVFLMQGGKVAVADFGLGRVPDPLDKAGRGTDYSHLPEFLAPEQAAGDYDRVDQRSDVYSLGILLYKMLTAASPFENDRSGLITYQVINVKPLPPRRIERSVPKGLEAICLKAIRKKPHERYWSVAEMGTDLKRFLTGEPIRAREESGMNRMLALITSSGKGLILAFAGALILAVSGGLLIRCLLSDDRDKGRSSHDRVEPGETKKTGERERTGVKKARAAFKVALTIPLKRGKFSSRIRRLKRAVKLDPDFHLAHLYLAYNLLLAGKVQLAVDSLSRGSVGEESLFSKYLWGLVYHEYLMNIGSSLKEFEQGATLASGDQYGPLCRAWHLWLTTGDGKKVLELLKEADEASAYPWETGLLKGIVFQAPPDTRLRAARIAYSRSTEALGGYPPALARRALAFLEETGLSEKQQAVNFILARNDLNDALAVDPSHAYARVIRGRLRQRQGKFKDATDDLRLAVAIAPRYWEAWYTLGDCLLGAEDFEEAVEALTQAIDMKPRDPSTYLKRAYAYFRNKGFGGAESDYRTAVRLAPFSGEMRFHLGRFLEALGRMKESLISYNEAIRLAPKAAEYYRARGDLFFNLEKYAEALQDFEKAILNDPAMAWAYYRAAHILVIYEKNPDFALAIDYVKIGLLNCRDENLKKRMKEFLDWLEQQEKKQEEKK